MEERSGGEEWRGGEGGEEWREEGRRVEEEGSASQYCLANNSFFPRDMLLSTCSDL